MGGKWKPSRKRFADLLYIAYYFISRRGIGDIVFAFADKKEIEKMDWDVRPVVF